MVEDFPMGSVGPDDDDDQFMFIPHQAGSIELTEEQKQELQFVYTVGSRKITNAMAILEDENKMSFIIEDLLPETGLVYFAGLSGTGKTILATQVVSNLVLGKPTMTWQISEPYRDKHLRILMLSLEMNNKQLQRRLEHMFPKLTEEEQKLFRENFLTYCEPEPFELWNVGHIVELARIIKECKVDILLIDSASVSFGEELTNQQQVNASVKNLYRLRSRLGLSMFIVAHTRKPPAGIVANPEDATLNELFGHSGVAQSADAIVMMLEDEQQRKNVAKKGKEGDSSFADKTEKLVHIVNVKNRYGANSGAYKTYLTSKEAVDNGEPLMFRRNAIPIAMTAAQRKKLNADPELNLAAAMEGVDFSAIGDDDD